MSDELTTSTVSRARPSLTEPSSARARLTVVHPRALRSSVELGEGACLAGRHPSAGEVRLTLAHPTVSRSHCSVRWDPRRGAHLAEDQGSHNGTHLEGARLGAAAELEDGALLRLGDVLLVYERVQERARESSARVSQEALPGRAASLDPLREALLAAAAEDTPALLVGETGTGKEHLARELHRLSGRAGPFLALNCAALSAELVEAQLFGHTRGAFTGATEAQPGVFRAAAGGTLLLDEVGDLPLPLQPKLLRALQEREVHPVGASRPVPVDVRVLAATHAELSSLSARGAFRADLYARLSLRELAVPPLRRRRVDLFTWLERWSSGPAPDFDADAAEALLLHRWPLNLRGLERLLRELAARGPGPHALRALPAWWRERAAPQADAGEPEATAQPASSPVPTREDFVAAYEAHGGSVRALARHFGRDRRQIYRWVEAYGLRPSR